MMKIKEANKELAKLKGKANEEKKELLYEREFCSQYIENFKAKVFPASVMIEALQEVADDSEYAQWAYGAISPGLASGEVQFDIINWQLSTANYTTGSFDVAPEWVTIVRIDQNVEPELGYDIIRDVIGQDYDEILERAKSEFEKYDDEEDNEFLYRISDESKFDEILGEITGQSIEEWEVDNYCEDVEIDWDEVFEDYVY